MKQRSQLDILSDMLNFCNSPRRQYEILKQVNLSYQRFLVNVEFLLGLKFIKRTDGIERLDFHDPHSKIPNNALIITDKGTQFIQLLRKEDGSKN